MNGNVTSSVLKNGIRTAAAATSAAAPYLGKAAIAAISAGETANAPPEKTSWFTKKPTSPTSSTSPKSSWFARKPADPATPADPKPTDPATPTPATPTPANPADPTPATPTPATPTPANPADPATPTPATPATPEDPADPATPTPTNPDPDPASIVPETPEEENLLKKFLQKVRKGDLTDVVNSINDVKPESDDLTVFDQIKKKIKDGDFSDIVKSLPAPPPFPTAVVMQILMSLNEMFQQNIGKISKAVGDTIDIEIEKKKNELALTKALGEQVTKTELEPHMKAYIEHEFAK